MLLNILTGYRDVVQESASDIVVLVARLPALIEAGVRCVTTDRHAFLQTARFFPGLAGLQHLDWPLLQGRDFRRDPARPDRFERYQAEALIHGSMPPSLLRGVVCATEAVRAEITALIAGEALELPVTVQQAWYE